LYLDEEIQMKDIVKETVDELKTQYVLIPKIGVKYIIAAAVLIGGGSVCSVYNAIVDSSVSLAKQNLLKSSNDATRTASQLHDLLSAQQGTFVIMASGTYGSNDALSFAAHAGKDGMPDDPQHSGWLDDGSSFLIRRNPISFNGAFAAPPKVVVALSSVNCLTAQTTLMVFADNITKDGADIVWKKPRDVQKIVMFDATATMVAVGIPRAEPTTP
jgi:hypothetical protein